MKTLQFVAITAFGALVFGCASPEPQASSPAANVQPAQASVKCYKSGSRLPSTDEDCAGGSSMVGGQSREDYMHDRAASPTPLK